MSATKNRFSCGHKGYGKFCHRCQQAELLEAKAKEISPSGGGKGKGKNTEEEPVRVLLEEAKRLRGPQKSSSRVIVLPD